MKPYYSGLYFLGDVDFISAKNEPLCIDLKWAKNLMKLRRSAVILNEFCYNKSKPDVLLRLPVEINDLNFPSI